MNWRIQHPPRGQNQGGLERDPARDNGLEAGPHQAGAIPGKATAYKGNANQAGMFRAKLGGGSGSAGFFDRNFFSWACPHAGGYFDPKTCLWFPLFPTLGSVGLAGGFDD
jgi:hypothetical protein